MSPDFKEVQEWISPLHSVIPFIILLDEFLSKVLVPAFSDPIQGSACNRSLTSSTAVLYDQVVEMPIVPVQVIFWPIPFTFPHEMIAISINIQCTKLVIWVVGTYITSVKAVLILTSLPTHYFVRRASWIEPFNELSGYSSAKFLGVLVPPLSPSQHSRYSWIVTLTEPYGSIEQCVENLAFTFLCVKLEWIATVVQLTSVLQISELMSRDLTG